MLNQKYGLIWYSTSILGSWNSIEYLGSSAGCSTDDDEDQYGYGDGDDDDGDGDDADGDGDGDADDAADTARGLRGVADGGSLVVF